MTMPEDSKNYSNKDDQGRMKTMTTVKEKDLFLEILLGHVPKIIL